MIKPPSDFARIGQGLSGYTRGCARVHPLTKQKLSPPVNTKKPQTILSELPGGSGATPAGALARTCFQNKELPRCQDEKPPRRFYLNRPGARGLHRRGRSHAPVVKTKIPQMILPESPGGSGAPVGFINPGTLMDRLPSKGSAQQTTLRTTRSSWAGLKTKQ